MNDFDNIFVRFSEKYRISNDRVIDLLFRRINWSFDSVNVSIIRSLNSKLLFKCKEILLNQVVEEVSLLFKTPLRYSDYFNSSEIKELCTKLSIFASKDEVSSSINLGFVLNL